MLNWSQWMAAGGRGWARARRRGRVEVGRDGVERRVAKGADAREALAPRREQGARGTGGWLAAPSGRGAAAGGRAAHHCKCHARSSCARTPSRCTTGRPSPAGRGSDPRRAGRAHGSCSRPGRPAARSPAPWRTAGNGRWRWCTCRCQRTHHALISRMLYSRSSRRRSPGGTRRRPPRTRLAHGNHRRTRGPHNARLPTPRRSRNGRAPPTTRRGRTRAAPARTPHHASRAGSDRCQRSTGPDPSTRVDTS